MLCRKPFSSRSGSFGCGQCRYCRSNKRRIQTHRLLLERYCHEKSAFVTLTYGEDHFPPDGCVSKKVVQDWLKRLRYYVDPVKIRYFAVGEYGDDNFRPHYHLALFGLGRESTDLIRDTWGLGFVYVGDLTLASAQYVCKYLMKGMTRAGYSRLGGRSPEFSLPSRRPGIGYGAVPSIVNSLTSEHGCDLLVQEGDVPFLLRHGPKKMPLGRYMRTKLREVYGFSDTRTPSELLFKAKEEMSRVYEDFKARPENAGEKEGVIWRRWCESKMQAIVNFETKHKIYSKKGILDL